MAPTQSSKGGGCAGFMFLSQAVLRPFQRRFVRAATARGVDTAALSLPRGNGKSSLAGYLVTRILSPADRLFVEGTESVLCAANLAQARIVFRFARAALEPGGGYRFRDSANQIGITHEATRTGVRLIGSNGKGAMGLVGCPWVIADEPGAWETVGGQLMFDAIETAKGKPGSPLRSLYLGTIAPSTSGWWADMVADGSHGSTVVHALQGDPERWDDWNEIRRVNPLTMVSADFRRKLLQERDAARRDSRKKAAFLSYRLNVPTADEGTTLLTVDDWQRVTARPVSERDGRPIVGIDLGHSRAWSAAVALWRSGRIEAIAIAPGIPDLAAQEKRDRVPRNTYTKLVESGALTVAEGLRVPGPARLYAALTATWGRPERVICDYFKLAELRDVIKGAVPIIDRRSRWSDSTADIGALRKLAADGPLSCVPGSRALLTASLASSRVKNEEGNVRLRKKDTNNSGRDDVAAALVLAAGSLKRDLDRPRRKMRFGLAG